jgi:TRAP-type C4-dicarboxylate transport system substrate-binding protein
MDKKWGVALALLLCAGGGLFAAPKVRIRLASLAPEATAWGKALNRMATEWLSATGGEVELIVHHNGALGSDEGEVLKKLRANAVQAAVFTSVGMNSISKKIFTLSCPFFIRDDAELRYILDNVGAELETGIESEKFKLVAWSHLGWIRFFGREPIRTPADLKKQTLVGPPDMPELNNMFKSLGYTVVPTAYNDTLMALSSKKADAVFQLPPFVAAFQLFGVAKNMLPLNISPVMGGIVMNEAGWRRIPDKYKQKLLEISRRIAQDIDKGSIAMSAEAIQTMKRNGLLESSPSEADKQLWIHEMETAMPSFLGGRNPIADPVLYQRISDLLKTYRKK